MKEASLHGGAGGLDGDLATLGDGDGVGGEEDWDGLVGGAPVDQVAVAAVHADVIACAIVVVVTGVGRALVAANKIGSWMSIGVKGGGGAI